MARFVRGVIGLAVLLGLWEVACAVDLISADYVPPPSVTLPEAGQLLTANSDFRLDTLATVLAFLIALAVAALIAIPLGLLLGSVRSVRIATRTVVEFLRPIPAVALVPLVMLLLGGGPETKIVLGVYAATWPILFNTIYALDEIDPLHLDTARSFGLGKTRIVLTVALPHALPFIFTGIRVSASLALVVVVVSELLTGTGGGIGAYLLTEANSGLGQTDLVIAGTLVIGLIGYLINMLLQQIQRRAFRWDAPQEAQ